MVSDSDNYPEAQSITNEGLNYSQPSANDSALRIRLETDDTLEKIEMYLKGESWGYDENGKLVKAQTCEAKANEEGCRAIMSAVTSYINKSAVQGNLTTEEIGNILMPDFHRSMAGLFAFHSEDYGIKRSDRKNIVQFIEPFVFMFVSRTKDNKERESYGMTIRESGRQVITPTKKRGFLGF